MTPRAAVRTLSNRASDPGTSDSRRIYPLVILWTANEDWTRSTTAGACPRQNAPAKGVDRT